MNQLVYVLKEDIDSYLDSILSLESQFTLRFITKESYAVTLSLDLSSNEQSKDISYTIFISKKSYFTKNVRYMILEKTISSGVIAEPVFIVICEEFSETEINEIIGHNDNFLLIPVSPKDGSKTNVPPVAYLAGVVRKGMHDFDNNKTIVHHMRDSFFTFIEAEKHKEEKTEIEKMNNELIVENKIDTLTRIFNRKGILIEYEIAQSRTRREKKYIDGDNPHDHIGHLSCMLLDIDDFKKVNDKYGHLIGDLVLQKVAGLLQDKSIFRLEDICGRYGGEEFVVIFPNTNSKNAQIPAERFRVYLNKMIFNAKDGTEFHVTASIGIAELPYTPHNSRDSLQDMADLEVLIHRADQAMYEAKKRGKDAIVLFDEFKKK
jgi:diguanylate cyclase (GGDEF)-like protein